MTEAPKDPRSSGVLEEAQSTASALAAKAKDAALGVVDQQKLAAAEQIGEVAAALDTVAEGVERVLPQAAPYVREAVSTVHEASETLRETSLDDLIDMVADFGRRQPAVFLAACTFGGFVLARFLKSSADRRREEALGRLPHRSGAHAQGSR